MPVEIADGFTGSITSRWLSTVDPGPTDHQPVGDESTRYDRVLAEEVFRRRIRADAARIVSRDTPPPALPVLHRADQWLAEPDTDPAYLIDQWWPTGGRVLLAARAKAGKTTLVGELLRCLVDGDAWLDGAAVKPVGRIILLDAELDARMLRRWLRDHGIRHPERIDVIPLRGAASSLDLLDPDTRTRWTQHLGPADVIILDCLRPLLDAAGLDEHSDAGRWLEGLDELLREAGISHALVVHHMGHGPERARGDSRILDWPDAIWTLTVDADDEAALADAPRFLSARGRDVAVGETQLGYDRDTRRLSAAGGSRAAARMTLVLAAVLDFLADNPRSSKNKIEIGVQGQAKLIRSALESGVVQGLIVREKVGQAIYHTLVDPAETLNSSNSSVLVPDERTTPPRNLVPSYIDEDEDEDADEKPSNSRDEDEDEVRPSCSTCNQPMTLVEHGQTTHPGCEATA